MCISVEQDKDVFSNLDQANRIAAHRPFAVQQRDNDNKLPEDRRERRQHVITSVLAPTFLTRSFPPTSSLCASCINLNMVGKLLAGEAIFLTKIMAQFLF